MATQRGKIKKKQTKKEGDDEKAKQKQHIAASRRI
jgi:hypothetical protein